MRMKLTVAIVYCDKDKQYVPGLIRNIEDCVKFPHEIVLVDNTTEGDRVGEGRYFWMGGNRSAAQGRKKASELAEGDYIWFVDADDEVFPLEEPDGNFDMYVYGYEIFSGKDDLFRAEPEGDYVIEGEWLFNRTTYDYLGQTLWNKIIRLSVVREVESMIPPTWTSRPGEDILLYAACYVRSRSVVFRKPVIYRYRADRSVATNPSMTLEMFSDAWIAAGLDPEGMREFLSLIKQLSVEDGKTVLVSSWFFLISFVLCMNVLRDFVNIFENTAF